MINRLKVFAFLLLPASIAGAQLGTISFPNSGKAAAQAPFIRGMLLLHSFEYADAATAFREAQTADPGFAMAYWGEALSYTHAVWNQQDVAAGRAALARLGPDGPTRRTKAGTPREQMYMDAVEQLYGEGGKAHRDTLFELAVERIVSAYPNDDEAKVFQALALLGLGQSVRNEAAYMRAGAIAEDVLRRNPNHPGAAHFVIHAFDDPDHAPLGLWAARSYSKIAANAPHAQHMTTHIFLAMGMWDDVVSQNVIAAGPNPPQWQATHYTQWLGYGYLQQGRYDEARRFLTRLRDNAGNISGTMPQGRRPSLVRLRATYLIDGERWTDSAAMWSFAPIASPMFRGTDAYARAYAAIKRGDLATGETLAREVESAITADPGVTENKPEVTRALYVQLRALLAAAHGARDSALSIIAEAARLEDALPVEFGPPVIVKPSHELAGEMLLEAGRFADAQREFTRALQLAPGRSHSLIGLARAASRANDPLVAQGAAAQLIANWHGADSALPELAEMRRLIAARR